MDIKNIIQMDVMSLDILSHRTFVPRTFCPADVLSPEVLFPWTFCLTDVLSLYVMSTDVLSGHLDYITEVKSYGILV
jgi:hypothetical protein